MDRDISKWSLEQCFILGALLSGGRLFFTGEGGSGAYFNTSVDSASIGVGVQTQYDSDTASFASRFKEVGVDG